MHTVEFAVQAVDRGLHPLPDGVVLRDERGTVCELDDDRGEVHPGPGRAGLGWEGW